jgi:hypothetical protein
MAVWRHIMRKALVMVWTAALMACAAAPDSREAASAPAAPERPAPELLTRIGFSNGYSEGLSVWIQSAGGDIQEIGKMNRDAAGAPRPADSDIPPAGHREFRIKAGSYIIQLKNAAGELTGPAYEEIFFLPSERPYPLVLNPLHKRNVEAKILPPEIKAGEFPLLPEFKIFFSGEVIVPLAEEYIMLLKEGGEGLPLRFNWEDPRHLILNPQTALLPSTTYSLVIQLEIRDTGGDRILRGDEYAFKTAGEFDDIPPVDYLGVGYDQSVPGFLRMSWRLPKGTEGNELRFKNGRVLDLQGITTYTFTMEEAKDIGCRLVPYKIMDGGIRAYSKTAAQGEYTNPLKDLEARNAGEETAAGLGAIAGELRAFSRKTALVTEGKLNEDYRAFNEFQKQLDAIASKSRNYRYPDIILKNPLYKQRLEARPDFKKTQEDIHRVYGEIQKRAVRTMIRALGSSYNTRRKNIYRTMEWYNHLKQNYGAYWEEKDPALAEAIGKITKAYERR